MKKSWGLIFIKFYGIIYKRIHLRKELNVAHYVTCPICNKKFDRDKVECVKEGRRYLHVECAQTTEERLSKEEKNKLALNQYIMQLFGTEYVNPKIQAQIKDYVTNKGFTYNGILMSLKYFYEIKHGDIEKAHGRISIVEYIYQDAKNYYYDIWQAQQVNKGKQIDLYIPANNVKEITIKAPVKKPFLKRIFSFLDEEKEDS